MSRDQAIRQWRSEHVVLPFLEAAYKRRSTFTDALTVADQYHQAVDAKAKATRLEQIRGHYTELLREQKVTNIAYRSVDVQPFKSAVDDLSDADLECRHAVEALMDPTQINPENLKRLDDALVAFAGALVGAVREGEQYIRDSNRPA